MQLIPSNIWEQYSAILKKRAVPVSRHADYRKWLLYYLDFRSKYPLPDSRSEQVRLFIRKLREKKQKKGEKAGSFFPLREMEKEMNGATGGKEDGTEQRSGRRFNEWRCLKKSESPAWDKIIDNLKDIPLAKKLSYIPVVISSKEIDAVLKHLGHPYYFAVKLSACHLL